MIVVEEIRSVRSSVLVVGVLEGIDRRSAHDAGWQLAEGICHTRCEEVPSLPAVVGHGRVEAHVVRAYAAGWAANFGQRLRPVPCAQIDGGVSTW